MFLQFPDTKNQQMSSLKPIKLFKKQVINKEHMKLENKNQLNKEILLKNN